MRFAFATNGQGRFWALLFVAACAVIAPLARGAAPFHPPINSIAELRVSEGGEITIEVFYDSLAFALNDTSQNIPDGPMFELLDGPEETLARSLDDCRGRFEKLCVLNAGTGRVPVEVTAAPAVADIREWRRTHGSYPLPIKLGLSARASLPANATSFQIRFPEMLGDLILTIERPGQEVVAVPLQANELSPEFGVAISTEESAASPQNQSPSNPEHAQPVKDSEGTWSVFARFTALGFLHIIDRRALDHCLFVLGLFLLSPRLKPVLLQISAFTVAHTITLTLTSLHVIGLPAHIVEPAIAASVAFVGIENLFAKKVDAKRTAVSFCFGLVHGMGVATAFNEAGFPAGRLVPSLGAFTVGVEAGHLAVLAGAFAVLAWSRGKPWYRARVSIPISLAISAIALVWFVQRL